MSKIISISELENIRIDGIDPGDYPDLCDAYIASARWNATGEELTEEELTRIDPGEVNQLALLEVCGG